MAEVRAWVRKREGSGASASGVSRPAMLPGIRRGGATVSSGVAQPAGDAMGRVVDIQRDDFARAPVTPVSRARPGQPSTAMSPTASSGNPERGRPARAI